MTRLGTLTVAALIVGTVAAPAWADATVFIGATTTPANRSVTGLAVGFGLLVVGFEFEYAATGEDAAANAPSLKTGTGSLMLQTPRAIFGFQPYFTTGVGIYNETLAEHSDTSVEFPIGGGVKVSLVGPIRLRVDYRVFTLGSGALYSPVHRVYAGLNLKF